MTRLILLLVPALMTLAACEPTTGGGTDGKPAARVYRISGAEASRVQFRMLDSVNSLRNAAGQPPLAFDAQLNAAAATHSRDMSVQNRPWHFGSNGSSPIDRVQRVGYPRVLYGELISETYETEVETLAAWLEDPASRTILMDARATDMGFAWYQEPNGKIWWTLILGG